MFGKVYAEISRDQSADSQIGSNFNSSPSYRPTLSLSLSLCRLSVCVLLGWRGPIQEGSTGTLMANLQFKQKRWGCDLCVVAQPGP